jgi:hypothetical protein
VTSKHSNSSSQHVEEPQYRLSFTSGGLLVREAGIAASLYQTLKDWSEVRASLEAENLLQARTVSSGQRVAREVVQRLSELADDEVVLLIDATSTEQGYLMWAATCRRYSLLGEFAEEVLRERFLILAPTVDHSDFDSFVRTKTMWHEELAELKESTYRKLRANVFLMLREASLLGDNWSINPAMLTERLTEAFANGPARDIRFFPTNEPVHSRGGQ